MKDQQRYKSHIELIWKIANLLRGSYRPPQYRKVMLPLIVLRRLDCVLEATKKQVLAEHQSQVDTGKTAEVIEKIMFGDNYPVWFGDNYLDWLNNT